MVIKVYNKEFLLAFGKRLKELRVSKDLTQVQLAEKAGIAYSQIGRIERGEQNPTLSTMFVLAKALDSDLNELTKFDV